MENYQDIYYSYFYWISYYEIEQTRRKKIYFYKTPSKDLDEILANDRKNNKILAKARVINKINKKFKNP